VEGGGALPEDRERGGGRRPDLGRGGRER